MDKLTWLIEYLLREQPQYADATIPSDLTERRNMLRALMNMRSPMPISNDFLQVQDAYLQERAIERGIVDYKKLDNLSNSATVSQQNSPTSYSNRGLTSYSASGLILWQGDITRLKIDAIVNACNSQMLGCFQPLHGCIDNFIHTYAGVQLRLKMHEIMQVQGYAEPTGQAKLTSGYNLPAKYILHTVGPIVHGPLREIDRAMLRQCYLSCLGLAEQNNIHSIAFCCLSTGVFGFPQRPAAEIAVQTAQEFLQISKNVQHVVFNVFKDSDREIYEQLLR